MWKKNKIADLLISLIIGTCYSWALTANIISTTVLETDYFDVFLIVALITIMLLIIFYNKVTMLIALTALMLMITSFAVDFYIFEKPGEFYEHLREVYLFATGYIPYSEEYSNTIVVFISILICIYTVVFLTVLFSFFMLVSFGISIFFVTLIPGYSSEDIIFLTFLFSVIAIFIRKMNMAGGKATNSKTVLISLPVVALIITGASFLPTPATGTPVDIATLSQVIQKPYNLINDFTYGVFNSKYFSMQTAGFASETGKLGGKVNLSSRYVMSVYSSERPYLAGAVKDTYTGSTWLESKPDFFPYSTELYSCEVPISPYLVKKEDVIINIGIARTGTLFRPLNTFELSLDEEYQISVNHYGDIKTDKLLQRDSEYYLKYYSIDCPDEVLQYFLRQVDVVVPEGYENYVQLPETVTERVRNLTYSITKDADNYYDKVKELESYLSKYTYNIAPSDVPQDVDFVDYFLFEGREGYCTYYASAMAIMCRILGMPTKYVEGYVMPSKRNEYGVYDVTNNQAHAWVEVYFDGFGWMIFEPTAPYHETFYRPDTSFVNSDFNTVYNYYDDEREYYEQIGIEIPNISQPTQVHEDESKQVEDTTLQRFLKVVVIIAVMAVVLIIIVLVNLSRRFFNLLAIRRLSNGSAVSAYVSKMLTVAAILGYPIYFNETPYNYGQRLGKRFSFYNETYYIKDVIQIFSKARYGKKDISQNERTFVANCYKEIVRKAKKKLKLYVYLYYRYIAYKF